MSGCAGIGMSCMKSLKRVGQSTDPCGTLLESVSLWMAYLCGSSTVVDGVRVSTCEKNGQPFIRRMHR